VSSSKSQEPSWQTKRVVVVSAGVTAQLLAKVRTICARHPAFKFCGHTSSPAVLLREFIEQMPIPDIVLMDGEWLSDRKFGVLGRLHLALPDARTLLIGDSLDLETISHALRMGVWGAIAKARAALDLEPALYAIARRELWLSRAQLSSLLMLATPEPHPDLLELTPRENAVMRGVLSGYSNKQIARTLEIAEHTVKIHLHHIYGKLHLHRRVELLLRHGRGSIATASAAAWRLSCATALLQPLQLSLELGHFGGFAAGI
jgi:two-component system, NarL family, nitrate/nitrite response regulator NarL